MRLPVAVALSLPLFLLACSTEGDPWPDPEWTEAPPLESEPTKALPLESPLSSGPSVDKRTIEFAGGQPLVTDVSPELVRPGHVVSIQGRGLGDTRGRGRVMVDNAEAEILVWTSTHVVARIPEIPDGNVALVIERDSLRLSSRITVSSTASSTPMPTFVSLTFDDTHAAQAKAGQELATRGMRGTFYVNSTRIGHTGFMTLDEIRALASHGHEIGGHTMHHVHLPALERDEASRQVCDDRAKLLALGFDVRSFAYPGGRTDPRTSLIVAECGYGSARLVAGGIETVPAADPFALRIAATNQGTGTVEALKSQITRLDGTGGWATLVFHDVCAGGAAARCGGSAIDPAKLSELLSWIEGRKKSGTLVRTVHELTGGAQAPARSGPRSVQGPGPLLRNGSLEIDANSDGIPDCWFRGDPGARIMWSRSDESAAGTWAERLSTVSPSARVDRRLRSIQDSGSCAVSVRPDRSYVLSASYRGGRVALSASFRGSDGFWGPWVDSPPSPASAEWARASYSLPSVPPDATAVAVGFVSVDEANADVDEFVLAAEPSMTSIAPHRAAP